MILIFLVVFASAVLMTVNYFTVRTLSATRAIINGESTYSKAQKDASRYLQSYLNTRDEKSYNLYLFYLNRDVNDSLAFHGMLAGAPDSQILNNFQLGRNNADDSADIIWLVKHFKGITLFRENILLWRGIDNIVDQIHMKASLIHQQILEGTYTRVQAIADGNQLYNADEKLTGMEFHFSDIQNHLSRVIAKYLLIANLLIILLMICLKFSYTAITIRRMLSAVTQTENENEELLNTNLELDRFVYSASHDLRAPINSLKGLIKILLVEKDISTVSEYLEMIDKSLNQQDTFITEIINYSRNRRKELNNEWVNIGELVDSTISHLQYMGEAAAIHFCTESNAELVYTDPLRLKIILKNLVSNAIKFSDPERTFQTVTIKSSVQDKMLKLEVADNGIGVSEEFQEKIFEMFFVTLHSSRGSGLGLYITKEAVTRLNGTIVLTSVLGIGSCFAITIPLVDVPELISA